MLKTAVYTVFLCFACTGAGAQIVRKNTNIADSLRLQLFADSSRIFRKTLAKPYFKFENSVSLVSKDLVDLLGFLLGATFYDKHSFSLGYYFLDPKNVDSFSSSTDANIFYHYEDIHYYAFGYQYVLFNRRFVQLNVPLGIGFGKFKADINDVQTQTITKQQSSIIPVNAGIQLVLKPLKWAGVTAAVGYRNVSTQKSSGLILRGTYYSLGVWMDARFVNRHLRYYRKKHIYKKEIRQLSAQQP